MNKKLIEERLYERLNLPIKVDYEVSTRPHELTKAISKNISGGGICLSLLEKLLPDTRLKMGISIPKVVPQQEAPQKHSRLSLSKVKKAKSEDYELEGRVVWTRRIEVHGEETLSTYYDTGIQFLETNPVIIGKIVAHFHGREL